MRLPEGWLKRLRYRAEWCALRCGLTAAACADLATVLTCARAIARLALRHVLRREREWSVRNLALVFGPGLDEGERMRLATLALEHQVMSWLEGARAADIQVEAPLDVEPLRALLGEGRGVIGCGVHLGSWEYGVACAGATGLPVSALYREANNPLSEREFSRLRAAYGVDWIPRNRLVDAARTLQSGKGLMVMTDINTVTAGITAEFLGIPAQCPGVTARFALRFGSPIVPLVAVRARPGVARLMVGDPIRPEAYADAQDPVAALTRAVNAAFEPWIVEYAEQYNWLHPRWRCRPDGRAWTPADPLEAQLSERVGPFPTVPRRIRALVGA